MAEVSGIPLTKLLPPYMPVFYVSFVTALLLTPMMRMLAHRHGIVDDPDGRRKVHTQPIAYLGGVSIFLAWLAGVTVSLFLRPHYEQLSGNIQVPFGVMMGAATVVLFGLMDDVYSLTPRAKIAGQLLAALFLIIPGAIGLGQDFFLGSSTGHFTGAAWMIVAPLERMGFIHPAAWAPTVQTALSGSVLVVSGGIAVFVVVSTCNACNLLDGLDGLCSGVTGVMSAGYLILSLILASQAVTTNNNIAVDPVRITLSMALLGAVLGFLPYNFNPASIFMGDTGSMFLGYMCGVMMLLFGQDGIVRWFLSALVIFGLPMLDTLLAIVRRKLNDKPIFSADSNHFHHFLIKRGFTVRQAVLISYLLAAVFVSFGLVIVIFPTRLALGVYMVLFGWLVVAAFKMGMVFQQAAPVPENTGINPLVIHGDRVERLAAPLGEAKESVVSNQ